MSDQIDPAAKAVLNSFGMIFSGMYQGLRELSDDDLALFIKGCEQASETNCWFAIYQATQSLKGWAESEQRQRQSDPSA